jgi:PAS domain S-box-containing protein
MKTERERFLEALLESAVDYAIIGLDLDGLVTSWSQGAANILGWPEAEMIGRPATSFFTPEDRQAGIPQAEMKSALETGRGSDERWHIRKNGTRFWASGEMMKLKADNGAAAGFVKILRDKTSERVAALKLQELATSLEVQVEARSLALHKAEEALRQSQKMEALGQLTGGIAHDFNNLLTGIIGSLDILRRRLAAHRLEDLDRFMDAATVSAHRAASLTHRLLAFARQQSLDTRPSDVNELVAGMEDLLHRTLGETIALSISLDAETWQALADHNQLENAILNLCLNARDAMEGGGSLTIATANISFDAAYAAAHEDVEPGDYVVISVSDTGTGMTKEVAARAFDPFFTTKPIGEGTGLGLSMIYGFAKQSGGHVRIDSQPGQGTTVKIFLRRAEAVEFADAATEQEVPLGRGETVLVVEDDPTVRLLMVDVLDELGYRHIEVPDGQAAVPVLQSRQRIDLLLTDVGLPNLNGRQVAEIGRRSRPELKVLFVTGYAEKAALRHGFLEPGMEMLMKPFALEALALKIRTMIES